jgi:HEPN domain-containing protein
MSLKKLLKGLHLCITRLSVKESRSMQEHKQWLTYAENELKAAKLLRESLDGSVIMTQQAAEKALKAYLILKGVDPGKTHDLRDLVNKCAKHDQGFDFLKEHAIALNPYNLGTRYPDAFLPVPDVSVIDASIKSAAIIVEFVKNKVS